MKEKIIFWLIVLAVISGIIAFIKDSDIFYCICWLFAVIAVYLKIINEED